MFTCRPTESGSRVFKNEIKILFLKAGASTSWWGMRVLIYFSLFIDFFPEDAMKFSCFLSIGKNAHCSPHTRGLEPYYPGSAVRSGSLSEEDSPPSSSSPSSPLRQPQPFASQASSVFLPSFRLFCLVSMDFSHFQARETWSSCRSVLLKSFAYGKEKWHFPSAGNSIFSCLFSYFEL